MSTSLKGFERLEQGRPRSRCVRAKRLLPPQNLECPDRRPRSQNGRSSSEDLLFDLGGTNSLARKRPGASVLRGKFAPMH